MGYVGAGVAIASLAYGIYAGETQAAQARRGRRRQAQAQKQAMSRQAASSARSQGREAQRRRGRQLAIANAARIGNPTTPTPIDKTASPSGTGVGSNRTLG